MDQSYSFHRHFGSPGHPRLQSSVSDLVSDIVRNSPINTHTHIMAGSGIQKTVEATAGHHLDYLDNFKVVKETPKEFDITDLPVKPLNTFQTSTTTCTHAFDWVDNIELPNPDGMYDAIVSGRPLPPPIGFKKSLPPHTVQYIFIRNIDGTFSMLKHMHFQKRALITQVQEAIHGQGFGIDIDKFPARRSLPLILQHMIMSLGGVCVVRRLLATVHTDKKLFTEAQIDAGFDFIEDNAPMKSFKQCTHQMDHETEEQSRVTLV